MPHQQFIVVTKYNIFYFDINIIHKVILDFVLLNKYCFPYPYIKVMSWVTDQSHYTRGNVQAAWFLSRVRLL